MTKNGSRKFKHYRDKYNLDCMIHDRSFISELVYCDIYNRKSKLSDKQFNRLFKLIKKNNFIVVILDCSTEELVKRLNIRNDEEEIIINSINKLRESYRKVALKYNIKIIDCEKVNALKELEENINGYYFK